jgi:hypothetical protein
MLIPVLLSRSSHRTCFPDSHSTHLLWLTNGVGLNCSAVLEWELVESRWMIFGGKWLKSGWQSTEPRGALSSGRKHPRALSLSKNKLQSLDAGWVGGCLLCSKPQDFLARAHWWVYCVFFLIRGMKSRQQYFWYPAQSFDLQTNEKVRAK